MGELQIAQPEGVFLVVPGYLQGTEDRLKRGYSFAGKGENQMVWKEPLW